MTWKDAYESLEAKDKNPRFLWLCSDANPDVEAREAWRLKIVRKAQGAPDTPSMIRAAANAAGAVARVASAIVHGEPIFVGADVEAARKATCEACDHLVKNTCNLCGCRYLAKLKLKTEKCPIGKW